MNEITTVKNQVKFAGWISMVEECQNSGLSIRTWCKENPVIKRLHYYSIFHQYYESFLLLANNNQT